MKHNHELLLTLGNLKDLATCAFPYNIPIVPHSLPTNLIKGEHFILIDLCKSISGSSSHAVADECKTHLCFEFISHVILCILYPYSCKTHKIFSKLGFVGLLMKSK